MLSGLKRIIIFAGFIIAALLVSSLVLHEPAFAQTVDVGLEQAESVGLSGSDPRVIIARVIQVALGFLGIVALGLLLYAGYLWMTAAGNDDQVNTAKTLLRNGLIGLIIILSSFGIVTFVLNRLVGGPDTQPSSFGRRGTGGFLGGGGGFPLGVIESHYPDRGQTNLARNTNIMISFVEPMLIDSLINSKGTEDPADDEINGQNIFISRASDDPQSGPFVPARAAVSDDARILVIDPIDLLGSAEQNTMYRVTLGEGISTTVGKGAFGNFGAYTWEFEVGTFVDLEPPRVVSVIPQPDQTYARNIIVQVTFSEAMNPLAVSGDTARGFNNLSVRGQNGEFVAGRFTISNQYRTAEFVTNDLCGTNSCGQDVFCLPPSAKFTARIRAAMVSAQPPVAVFPFDGVVDASGNSFDGNVDGAAQGSPADDFAWSFQTTDQIDLRAPVVSAVSPQPYATLVPRDSRLTVTFDKALWLKTINRQTVQVPGLDYQISSSVEENQTVVQMVHAGLDENATYTPVVSSNVKDIYQNCYQPCVGP